MYIQLRDPEYKCITVLQIMQFKNNLYSKI